MQQESYSIQVTNPPFPQDIVLALPTNSALQESDLHFLLFIPWNDDYLQNVPPEYRDFFLEVLPYLSARTTDVHTAICMQYLAEAIAWAQAQSYTVNRAVLACALMLHDSGWSQMTEQEIAFSLGIQGLALNDKALGPKEKHAVIGAEIATKLLSEKQKTLGLLDSEIRDISQAILYHDKPEMVAGLGNEMPIEVQLLVDLDHLWSFTHLNFWQDTLRKGVSPTAYLANLAQDLDGYFVTQFGKDKAKQLLLEREQEVEHFI